MAAAPNYKVGHTTDVTFGGVVLNVNGGNWDSGTEFDDATGTKGGGFKSSVPTIRELTGSFDVTYDGDEPPTWEDGDYLEGCTCATPGSRSFNADLWIDKISNKNVDPRGKVSFTIEFHSEGSYTLGW